MSTRIRLRRVLAVIASMAMVMALAPLSTAFADTDNACDAAPASPDFTDVDEDGGTFGPFIACIAGYDLVDGFEDGSFGPGLMVKRGQASKFVSNFIETAQGKALDLPPDNPFEDVDENGEFGPYILKLYNQGIVEGVTSSRFEPGELLSRGQMSKIVALALQYLGIDLDDTSAGYSDVNDGGVFGQYINMLTNAGIVDGYGDGTFGPADDVSRGQLSKFTANGAGTADDNNLWQPTRLVGPVPTTDDPVAEAGGTITVTVTVYDEDGNPVEGTAVDAFVVDGDQNYNDDGTPNYATDATIDGGNNQTGLFQGTIDPSDPQSDADGQVNLEISKATEGEVDVIVWTGANGDQFDDDEIDPDNRGNLPLTFTPAPSSIMLAADRDTNVYPYGDSPMITAQLVDDNGDPVTREGAVLRYEVTRDANPPTSSGTSVATGEVTTDEAGRASFTTPAPADPDGSADNETSDEITIYYDEDDSGDQQSAETTEGSLGLTFDDTDPEVIGSATLSHDASNSPYDPTVDTNLVDTMHTVMVSVFNVYGDPLDGLEVDFSFSVVTGADATRVTNADGVATRSYTGPGEPDTETISATVDPDDQAVDTNDLTKYWVRSAAADEDDTANGGLGENIAGVSIENNQVSVVDSLLRFTYDDDDTYMINGSEVERTDFEQAIAEASANDRLSVDYTADGASTYDFLTPPF